MHAPMPLSSTAATACKVGSRKETSCLALVANHHHLVEHHGVTCRTPPSRQRTTAMSDQQGRKGVRVDRHARATAAVRSQFLPTLWPTMFSVTMLSSTVTLYCLPPISATAKAVGGVYTRPVAAATELMARMCPPASALPHRAQGLLTAARPAASWPAVVGCGKKAREGAQKAVRPAAARTDGARESTAHAAPFKRAPTPDQPHMLPQTRRHAMLCSCSEFLGVRPRTQLTIKG